MPPRSGIFLVPISLMPFLKLLNIRLTRKSFRWVVEASNKTYEILLEEIQDAYNTFSPAAGLFCKCKFKVLSSSGDSRSV